MRLHKLLGTRLSLAGVAFTAALAITAVVGLVHPAKTYAVPAPTDPEQIRTGQFTFLDRATIQATINGQTYIFLDRNITDNDNGDFNYKLTNSDCTGGDINFPVPPSQFENVDRRLEDLTRLNSGQGGGGSLVGKVTMKINLNGNTSCGPSTPTTIDVNVDRGGMGIWYVRVDANTLIRADGESKEKYAAIPGSNGSIYLQTSASTCKDVILFDGNGGMQLFRLDPKYDGNQVQIFGQQIADLINQPDCKTAADKLIQGVVPLGTQTNNAEANGNGTGTGTNAEDAPSCENNTPWSLNWLVCPLIEGIQAGLDGLIHNIDNLLELDSAAYDRPDIKSAWSNINRLAAFGLVAAALIMVISTALGFGIVDAYTLRKVLPRILIAAIAMQLSWYLMKFFIEGVNDVGKGLSDLMYAPFGGRDSVDLIAVLDKSNTIGGGGSNGLFLGATLAGLGIAGLTVIFSFALTCIGIVLVAFLILLLRRMIIVTLIVLAPLAIVSSILPNTDGFWKFWNKLFVNLLFLYPLMMMLIAGGRIFAYIAAGQPNLENDGFVASNIDDLLVVGAIAIGNFGTLAGVPWLASRIGGFVGNLTGMVNNRGKGFFDRQRNKRAEAFKQRKDLAGRNQLYGASSPFRKLNNVAGWAFSPVGNTRYALGAAARKGGGAPDTRLKKVLAWAGGSVYSDVDAAIGSNTDKLAQHLMAKGVVIDKAHLALSGNLEGDEEAAFRQAMTGLDASNKRVIGPDGKEAKQIMSIDEYEKYKKSGVTSDGMLAKVREGLMAVDDPTMSPRFRDAAAQLGNIQGQIGEFHNSTDYGKGNIKMASSFIAASQGFMSPEQITKSANDLVDSGYSQTVTAVWAGKTSAAAFGKGVLEAKPTYGVRQGADGKFYNAMDGAEFARSRAIIDDPNADVNSEAFARAKAFVDNQVQLVSSFKQSDWSTMKGKQRVRNLQPVLEYMLNDADRKYDTVAAKDPGNVQQAQAAAEKTQQNQETRQRMAVQLRQNLDQMTRLGNADVASRAAIQTILADPKIPIPRRMQTAAPVDMETDEEAEALLRNQEIQQQAEEQQQNEEE